MEEWYPDSGQVQVRERDGADYPAPCLKCGAGPDTPYRMFMLGGGMAGGLCADCLAPAEEEMPRED